MWLFPSDETIDRVEKLSYIHKTDELRSQLMPYKLTAKGLLSQLLARRMLVHEPRLQECGWYSAELDHIPLLKRMGSVMAQPLLAPVANGADPSVVAAVAVFNHSNESNTVHRTGAGMWPPEDVAYLDSCGNVLLAWLATIERRHESILQTQNANLLTTAVWEVLPLVMQKPTKQEKIDSTERKLQQIILTAAAKVTQAQVAVLYQISPDGQVWRQAFAITGPGGVVRYDQSHTLLEQGTLSACSIATKALVNIPEVKKQVLAKFDASTERAIGIVLHSLLSIPLLSPENRVFGAIEVYNSLAPTGPQFLGNEPATALQGVALLATAQLQLTQIQTEAAQRISRHAPHPIYPIPS